MRPHALVTDENQSLIAVVDLRSRSARRFIGIRGNPQYVAAAPRIALVTSPSAGTVTALRGDPLRVVGAIRGFGSPHVIEFSPDRRYAYVTDDARGSLTAIRLGDLRVIGAVHVGAEAHHMTSSPNGRWLWIALGESARTIVIVDSTRPGRLRQAGQFHTSFAAHDLAFTPDGRSVWVSSAGGPDVTVFRASDHRPQLRIAVGPPPQHIAFAGASAYLTSGYGSTLEQVSARTGKVIRRVRSPYGSFEVAAAGGCVTTASLLNGELAIYTPRLRLLHVLRLGPATRDVDITTQ
jgi:DNA-binding beta-propeller fold protein YncE